MIIKIIKKILRNSGYNIQKIKVNDINDYLKIYSKEDLIHKNFYNIGAGSFEHPAWTNVDYYSDWYEGKQSQINYNLLDCKPLPVEDSSANIVYSSHTIEHINDEAAQYLFNESYRILKPNGYLRLTCPNIDLHYRAFIDKDYFYWKNMIDTYSIKKNMERAKIAKPMNEVSLCQIFLHTFASQVSILHPDKNTTKILDEEFNYIFLNNNFENALNIIKSRCMIELQSKYPGNHINWWNKDKLFRMLKLAKFDNIFNSGYGQSHCAVMRNTQYFDNTHPEWSIYIEAKK